MTLTKLGGGWEQVDQLALPISDRFAQSHSAAEAGSPAPTLEERQ